ncbi:MAG: trehalose-6-phosphate synthase [Alphaproteobacteria bacterium]|uniref:Trehalose-6-phosphate synthase n=1 Tax=Candidatus Nitrobium versatile TaxID=2884831 RepID=A0A953M234_9BACT|nr:trehalose-6-phosphate synthase [Candidatus Nitrobium versatile]
MKITIRLIVSLTIVIAAVTAIFSLYQVHEEKQRLIGELERRTLILADSLQESVVSLIQSGSPAKLNRLVVRFGNRERLRGVVVFDGQGAILASTPELREKIPQPFPEAVRSFLENRAESRFIHIEGKKMYVYVLPLAGDEALLGTMALLHDTSYIDVRLKEIGKHNLFRFLAHTLLVVLITLVVVRWSITGPIAQIAAWMREQRMGRGRTGQPMVAPRGDMLAPLVSEVAHLAKSLALARAKADEKTSMRLQADSSWTAQRLKEHMQGELRGRKLFVVSNREPYMHLREGSTVKCIIPAGGLVTALDPVMRISNGTWIANGSGDADRDAVDAHDRLRVPPEDPSYTLKRVWFTKKEEEGYYYGFSNEGMWPLCHITHTRPIFRLEDWVEYQKVNEKFSEALLQEIDGEEAPLVLIQDYHLALLPLLVKKRRPDAKVALFWHIPWPNPESFSICPWQQEILLGMLGADIIGFHIQFHCNNFLDTVDRFLESKIDWEQFSVSRGGHTTLIKPFPISVRFDDFNTAEPKKQAPAPSRAELLAKIGVQAKYLGVGVDRIDYTKGLPERFRAIERFLEKYPEFIGSFTFVELGAPSRTHIKRYYDLLAEVDEAVSRINWRFQTKEWKPIVFLKAHHSHDEINRFYRAADLCMVTSLHDGMNLVAKEFVSSRDDGEGVLILSQFAGASRELKDAVIINPYDREEMADALFLSLTMKQQERTERMRRMRRVVGENNIYRWAGDLITALARLRSPESRG